MTVSLDPEGGFVMWRKHGMSTVGTWHLLLSQA